MRIGKLSMVLGVVAVVAGLFSLPTASSAYVLLNVDMNTATSATYTGLAAAPDPAGASAVWNGIAGESVTDGWGNLLPSPVTSTGLVDSLNNSSPITVTWHGYFHPLDYHGSHDTAIANDLLVDGADGITSATAISLAGYGVQDPGSQFTINNLDPSKTYDLYLYGTGGSVYSETFGGYDYSPTFFVDTNGNGVLDDGSITMNNAAEPVNGSNQVDGFALGANYALYSNLSPTALGTILVGYQVPADSADAVFNGFQLVELPEPASMSLLAVGGLLLLKRRRA